MAETVEIAPKRNVIAVISGKGGVGKTTLSLGAALALNSMGSQTGLMDLDIESSSLGDAMNLGYHALSMGDKINPADFAGLKAASLSMFLPDGEMVDTPTLVDEERVGMIVTQMFDSIDWGELDYLIVDTPPGTGPELRSLVRNGVDALILVTATQRLSEMPVRRLVRMAREEFFLPIIGVISNNPYNTDGHYSSADALSERYDLPVITEIPWTRDIATAMDDQVMLPETVSSSLAELFLPVAEAIEGHFMPGVTLRVREAIRLTNRGVPRKEIAAEMGVSYGRVGQLLGQARKQGLLEKA